MDDYVSNFSKSVYFAIINKLFLVDSLVDWSI